MSMAADRTVTFLRSQKGATHVQVLGAKPMHDEPFAGRSLGTSNGFPDTAQAVSLDLHQANADAVLEFLLGSLPGGTIDQLLIKLLQHRASHLIVRYAQRQSEVARGE